MEENKKERSSAEIQQEYQQVCAKAGHLQYSIAQTQLDLEQLNAALRGLQVEHSKAKEREKNAAKSAEAQEESK